MRFTSANTAPQTDTRLAAALYDVMNRKQAPKIDFLKAFFASLAKLGEAKGRLEKIHRVSGA
jgi:hypothetical protein